jgi:hypothetical protein
LRAVIGIALVALLVVVDPSEAFDLGAAALDKPDLSKASRVAEATPMAADWIDAETSNGGEKSTGKAVLYSLLLPGLGQSYLGETGEAKIFFTVEAVIMTSLVVFLVQEDLREDEYIQYAQTFAGVQNGHSDEYYGILTSYDSSGDYEDEIKSEGRLALYPNIDTASLESYFAQERIADYEPWTWQSADHRRAYQDRRADSKTAERRALYAVAAAVANRVASAFFAYRSSVRANHERSASPTQFSIQWDADGSPGTQGFRPGVSLVRSF